ncbi:MAG TPA: inorganic diphosphatase [Acidobacteriota bacterium]|nr:inorganic diphosphatase [Acidobacteriota bacterium]
MNKYIEINAGKPQSGLVNVIIDTPQTSPHKYKFDEKLKLFRLRKVMSSGSVFPFNFGYIPSTRGGDGDPLDVLVLMDAPAFVGCLVEVRLIGVIEAKQKERNGRVDQNDRLLGIAQESKKDRDVKSINKLNQRLVEEIEHFFIAYNEIEGKEFQVIKRSGPQKAKAIVLKGIQDFKKGLK